MKEWMRTNWKAILLFLGLAMVIGAVIFGIHSLLIPALMTLFPKAAEQVQNADKKAEKKRDLFEEEASKERTELEKKILLRKEKAKKREANERIAAQMRDRQKSAEELKKELLKDADDVGVDE